MESEVEEAALPARPTPPRKYDPEAIRVTFAGMNLADFPEINDPDNIALQFAGEAGAENDPEANDWIFSTNWYTARLSRSARAGVYQLYLANDDEEFTTQVEATLLPQAYEAALAEYRRKVAAYEAAMQNMDQTRERIARIRRSMAANRFGIYNYDVYSRWEEPVFANVSFQKGTQDAWTDLDQVFLVTDEGKITVRYPRGDWRRFNFDRNRKNLLLGFTSTSEVVVLSPADFTDQSAGLAANERGQEWDCVLEENAFKFDSPANLQELIDRHFAG